MTNQLSTASSAILLTITALCATAVPSTAQISPTQSTVIVLSAADVIADGLAVACIEVVVKDAGGTGCRWVRVREDRDGPRRPEAGVAHHGFGVYAACSAAIC